MNIIRVLSDISKYIAQKGFRYPEGTAENLYLALKSQPFAVICGNSGVGKTALARLFTEALGATSQNGRFSLVSVCSDWESPDVLLGKVRDDGSFVPGLITGFLKRAIDNPTMPYFLCLDEFNLSRPEQYMSSILSAMPSNGSLLLGQNSYGADGAAYESYGDIYLPDNVYILATASSDEVSYPLSPRILERAFVIELTAPDITFNFSRDGKPTPQPVDGFINEYLKGEYVTADDIDSDLEILRDSSFVWDKFNKIIKHLSSPLGFRSRDAILFYTVYARRYEVFDKDTLTDLLIMQKLLLRVHGANTHVKKCLCELFMLCLGREGADSEEYISTSYKMYQASLKYGCRYPRSAEKITHMLRRYEEDGYATYWQR